MKALLVVASFLALSAAVEFTDDWRSFRRQHGKTYRSQADEEQRFQVYTTNKKRIDDHNAMFNLGLVPYRMRMNRFGDLTPAEVSNLFTGFNKTGQLTGHVWRGITYLPPANVQIPAAIDWRRAGVVSRVKDQGRCGSSWAFAATGAMEGQVARNLGNPVEALSEQNLIDCSSTYGNEGCNGGLVDYAFDYIAANGIVSEDTYPYEAEPHFCRHRKNLQLTKIKDHVDLKPFDEEALKAAVATAGPVAVSISAANPGFMFYGGGILTGETCNNRDKLDHAVLVVGYGSDRGRDFWIIKNSWGTSWGEEGYVRLARNQGNACGIASMASFPVLADSEEDFSTIGDNVE